MGKKMEKLENIVKEAECILIAGHKRPDGDCIGACIAACRYLRKIFPEREIDIYLENMPEAYAFLDEGKKLVKHRIEKKYDFFLAIDSSTADCLGDAQESFRQAAKTVCIDHHISNVGYAMVNIIEAHASSSCEVLFTLMDETYLDEKIAEALYIGLIYDTGVFRYSNTSKRTMEIAGKLMEQGIPFWEYIDKCYYQRTYTQTQLLGRTLLASMRLMDGRCIAAAITRRVMEFYEAKPEDIDGIVEQMRITRGVEVAILLLETGEQEYKVSMRSNDYVDLSQVATYFGGGGHKKAAGCSMHGSLYDVLNNLTARIELQIKGLEELYGWND